jgi:hypothetical protein
VLCYSAYLENSVLKETVQLPRPAFSTDSYSNAEFRDLFRINKHEVAALIDALGILSRFPSHSCMFSAEEAVCFVFRRLASRASFSSLSIEFRRAASALSALFTDFCNFLYEHFHARMLFDSILWQAPWLERSEAAIVSKGGIPGCVGFIDGTFIQVCQPTREQESYYSGHKKCHGLKFIAISSPTGLIGFLSDAGLGPLRSNVISILNYSQLC